MASLEGKELFTAQEERYVGGSASRDILEATRSPWKPLGLVRDMTIDELNSKRSTLGTFHSLAARAWTGEDRVVLGFSMVGEDGEVIGNPQVFVKDGDQLVHTPELEAVFYQRFQEEEVRIRKEEPDAPEWYWSAFIREPSGSGESEGALRRKEK